jgi:hypothetical protein
MHRLIQLRSLSASYNHCSAQLKRSYILQEGRKWIYKTDKNNNRKNFVPETAVRVDKTIIYGCVECGSNLVIWLVVYAFM